MAAALRGFEQGRSGPPRLGTFRMEENDGRKVLGYLPEIVNRRSLFGEVPQCPGNTLSATVDTHGGKSTSGNVK